jgi:hypothetical protein
VGQNGDFVQLRQDLAGAVRGAVVDADDLEVLAGDPGADALDAFNRLLDGASFVIDRTDDGATL